MAWPPPRTQPERTYGNPVVLEHLHNLWPARAQPLVVGGAIGCDNKVSLACHIQQGGIVTRPYGVWCFQQPGLVGAAVGKGVAHKQPTIPPCPRVTLAFGHGPVISMLGGD